MTLKKIKSALISVYYKDNLEPLIRILNSNGVTIYSTGGTKKFISDLGIKVTAVEDLTDYPAILGGRVKTLHPKVFGGILYRRDSTEDETQVRSYDIPPIDLVIVDLYPFEATVESGASDEEIIEKIDIGGISLIRAAAKNFKDVMIIPSRQHYQEAFNILKEKQGHTDIADRKRFASYAFDVSSHYDTSIFNYFNKERTIVKFKRSEEVSHPLRYGENPHQTGVFFGNLQKVLYQLNGKELSYNNLVDIDAGIALIEEFPDETAFAILKHTNACGVATADTVKDAYLKAFESDPVSPFGGVLVTNKIVDRSAAEELNKLFFEVIIAPDYDKDSLDLLKSKKNRIILKQNLPLRQAKQFKSILNGVLQQDRDLKTEGIEDLKQVTERKTSQEENEALVFANKIVKHTKSNAIVIAKKGQLISSGIGQTSRVDALKQAIEKAKNFGLSLEGAVMASDAFFPFPDCVEIAHKEGINAIVQPGGSVKDQESIDYCNKNDVAMVFTGFRHFKH